MNESQAKKGVKKGSQGELMIRPKMHPPISKVLLVGGATRMPIFQKFVENMTGIAPDPTLINPDLVDHSFASLLLSLLCSYLQLCLLGND